MPKTRHTHSINISERQYHAWRVSKDAARLQLPWYCCIDVSFLLTNDLGFARET